MDRVSVIIRKHLNFNMAEIFYVLLDVHTRISECRSGFLLGNLNAFDQFFFCACDPDAFSASARSGFYNDRIPNFTCKRNRFFRIFMIPFEPGTIGTPASCIVSRAISFVPILKWRQP